VTTDEVVEAVACALIDENLWLCDRRGVPLLPDAYRGLARAAVRRIQELRLTAVTREG
jgi:hypothetical protein